MVNFVEAQVFANVNVKHFSLISTFTVNKQLRVLMSEKKGILDKLSWEFFYRVCFHVLLVKLSYAPIDCHSKKIYEKKIFTKKKIFIKYNFFLLNVFVYPHWCIIDVLLYSTPIWPNYSWPVLFS